MDEKYFQLPPAPRNDDRLFGSDGSNWTATACLTSSFEGDLPYVEGYRRGARQLAEYVCETGSDKNFLVYPIVYLYRHHLELVLKRLVWLIAFVAEEKLNKKALKDLENQHGLDQLWGDFKCLLKTDNVKQVCKLKFSSDDFAGIDSYIKQLSEVDPKSTSFRYKRNKEGLKNLPETLTHINIGVFADRMESLCTYLDGVDSYLDYLRENKEDAENYYSS